MSSRTSRPRSRPKSAHRSAWIGTGFAAVAASTGLLAAAAPAAAQSPSPIPLLDQGSAGPAVSRVQQALHIQATGRFGRATKRAVLAFQRRDRLAVDGIVGTQTWDALFGIRAQPAPATPPGSSSTTAGASGGSSSTGGYTIPSGIVQCESGGNYAAVNPSSGAGGAYQILPSTWSAYGGQGLPQDAPKAEQDRIAAEIYAHQGASAWTC
ncbi:MAG: transglycosylase family protein [Actinomycetota bacterium]|nr:transglycosylase family protein [Actinomycetota bacterium]